MKRFWIITTLAVLAAMTFGSMLHRRGQESSAAKAESDANMLVARVPSFVAESQLPVQETEMPFEFPLMPDLLPEPKSNLPQVKFVSESGSFGKEDYPKVNRPVERGASAAPAKSHLSTVDLSKIEMPEIELVKVEQVVEEKVETASVESDSNDGRFLPIVLHIGSEDGRLVLQGSIPTRENTDAVYAAAVRVAGEDLVDSYLKYSPETLNADWVAFLPEYLETFFGHSGGDQELIVVDGILKLRGDVPSENSKNGLVTLAGSLKKGGLEIDAGLAVKESLAGELPELPGSYAAIVDATPVAKTEPKEELELAMLDTADQIRIGEDAQSRAASILADEREIKSEEAVAGDRKVVSDGASDSVTEAEPAEKAAAEPVNEDPPSPDFVGPAVSPEAWAAGIKKAKDELAAAEAAKKAAEVAAAKAKTDAEAAALVAAEKKKAEMEALAKAEMEALAKAKAEEEAAALAAAAKKKLEMAAAAKLKAQEEAAALAAAAKKKAEMEAAALVAAEKAKAEKEAADAAAKEAKLEAMLASGERIPDDGKPLIFYFETGSSEIISSDREKLARAIQRVQVPRSIVYITAYADYRGGYEANRKLSLERAEKVRGLIFAGEVADQVTAEITAKGDSQSVKRDMGARASDEALKRARRVVVEVYHLKR